MLLVLFAVTPICCTCRSDEQRDIYHASPCFVPQFAFSPLNMLLIFLQWLWGPFLQCNVLFTGNELIFSERMTDPTTVTRGEGIRWRLINVTFTNNSIILGIRSGTNVIKVLQTLWFTYVNNSHVWPLDFTEWPLDFSREHKSKWPSVFNVLRNTDLLEVN